MERKNAKCRMSVEELFAANINPGLADYLRATGEAYALRNGDGASTRSLLPSPPPFPDGALYRICPERNSPRGTLCSDSKPFLVTRTMSPTWTPAILSRLMTFG